jgi:hypothetical protein
LIQRIQHTRTLSNVYLCAALAEHERGTAAQLMAISIAAIASHSMHCSRWTKAAPVFTPPHDATRLKTIYRAIGGTSCDTK